MPNRTRAHTLGFRAISSDGIRLRASFIALVLIIVLNSVWLIRSFEDVKNGQEGVVHTYGVLNILDSVLNAMIDQETGFRGYFLSRGDVRFLEPYQNSKKVIDRDLARLEYLVRDNPLQTKSVVMLKDAVMERQVIMEGGLQRLMDSKDFSKFDDFVLHEGRISMDRVRSISEAMKNEEKRLLEKRKADDAQSTLYAERSIWASFLINLVLSLAAYVLLRKNAISQNEENWIQDRLAELALHLSGDLDLEELGRKTLQFFGTSLNAPVSSLYQLQGHSLHRVATFGFDETMSYSAKTRKLNETMFGETVQTKRPFWMENPPKNYLKVTTDLGQMEPKSIGIFPLTLDNQVIAVMEIALLEERHSVIEEFIAKSSEIVARNLAAAENRSKLQDLLEETQAQAEELQTQQEELRVTNEELTEQAAALNLSQEKLLQQQEELRQTNDQLEDQAKMLREQQETLEVRAEELSEAKLSLEERAHALEQASHYKSEFLANMSHELRTPLNSMLILSTLLQENSDGNLTEEQISFASTIHSAGADLLSLINDILDLSKVEAGKLDIYIEPISLESMVDGFKKSFDPLATNKGLSFGVHLDPSLPTAIHCDQKRLEQILRNFLSNAFKFTERGSIDLTISRPNPELRLVRNSDQREKLVAFSVIDTGIGIPAEKQKLIFEAFSQADGSTSRKYGGTGLGLTICRELAALLGGEMILQSDFGKGSVFTLVIPETCVATSEVKPIELEARPSRELAPISFLTESKAKVEKDKDRPNVDIQRFQDDRSDLQPDDKIILIVEDDLPFLKILYTAAKKMGFKVICATDGEQALADLKDFALSGVLLDMKLPGVSGLGLIESIKSSSETRHIPVHVISGVDVSQNALRMGALGYLMKPVTSDQLRGAFQKIEDMISRRVRKVLIVEDDERQRHAISRLIQGSDVQTDAVGLAADAQEKIRNNVYDCMILDLRLPDKSGLELLDALAQDKTTTRPPVIVYTGKELTRDEILQLRRYSDSIIIKGVKSPERLVDEVSLFLHRVESQLPENQQQLLLESRKSNKPFNGQTVLLVDDDLRNTFALMSALEPKGLKIHVARNGYEALQKISEVETIDLVLMDIMMPEMDGYTAMREIRKDPKRASLPIIALTAKAMRGDQERCLEAGANDYLPKPIDLERLMSVLKAWLPQTGEF